MKHRCTMLVIMSCNFFVVKLTHEYEYLQCIEFLPLEN